MKLHLKSNPSNFLVQLKESSSISINFIKFFTQYHTLYYIFSILSFFYNKKIELKKGILEIQKILNERYRKIKKLKSGKYLPSKKYFFLLFLLFITTYLTICQFFNMSKLDKLQI